MRVISLLLSVGMCKCACQTRGLNKRDKDEAMSMFRELTVDSFVGQIKAVKTVRDQIQDFLEIPPDGPLILHLVGPSGTGKSYLSEIIALSFFDDCDHVGSDILGFARESASSVGSLPGLNLLPDLGVGSVVRALTRRRCDSEAKRLKNWRQACGVVSTTFHDDFAAQEDCENGDQECKENGYGNVVQLKEFLKIAAEELYFEPQSVLVLDDFNFCTKKCAAMLKELITTQSLVNKFGRTVSASRAVIVLCSDMTNMGLMLDPMESYEFALQRVEAAAKDYWGETSVIISRSIHVPFAPLSDIEVIKIVGTIVNQVRERVRRRIDLFLTKKSKQSDRPYTWEGNFFCDEQTKVQIVDSLHSELEKVNARAITETFKEKLHASLKEPTKIEQRINTFKTSNSKHYSNQDIYVSVNFDDVGQLNVSLEVVA
mmetsp:Transcript_3111/g.4465  ORF Transcript_3111/g.4465 Transcript_3111/m.4465 type:complete len:429 (+) Transcript_3111:126-1412(+)